MRGKAVRRSRPAPMRPALPVTLPCAAAVWAATLLVGQGGDAAGTALAAVPVCLFVACALLGARHRKAACSLCALAALSWLLGAACSWAYFSHGEEAAQKALAAGTGGYAFVVQSDPRTSSYGSLSFKATAVSRSGSGAPKLDVWVRLGADGWHGEEPPRLGEVLALSGSFSQLDDEDDYEHSRRLEGCALGLRAYRGESEGFQAGPVGAVRSFRARMLGELGDLDAQGSSLVAGVVFGSQAAVSASGVSDTFSKLGLSHMIAVSGSHLALVAALVTSLARRTRLRPAPRTAFTVGLLAAYVCLTGFQVSAIRSFVMSSCALAGTVAGRRAQGLSSVCLAALAMLLVWPSCAFSLGFRLSVASVLALVVFGDLATSWVEALLPGRAPQGLASTLSLTGLAQCATAPMTLPLFGTVALLSFLANLVFVPLVSAVVALGVAWCAVSLALPFLAAPLLGVTQALASLVCRGAGWLAGLGPVAPVVDVEAGPLWALCLAFAAGAYAVWPRPSRRAARASAAVGLAAVSVALAAAALFPPERMVVLDVGQGDAILLQGSGATVLVDTGPDDAVVRALARQHVWRVDAVVVTHTDLDHVGGLSELVGHVGVGEVVFARGVVSRLEREGAELLDVVTQGLHAGVAEVGAGDGLKAGALDLEVLWPQGPVDGDENADSLVMLATWGAAGGGSTAGMSALLTGDAERDVVGPLVAQGGLGHVDVLKVGHHGSAVSTDAETVRSLSALVGVASAGQGNSYGHPRPEAVEAVEEGGAQFLCTAQAGDVSFYPQGDAIRVMCARGLPAAA